MTDELVEKCILVAVEASRSEGEQGDPIEEWERQIAESTVRAVLAAVTTQIAAHVTGEIVAWLQELATHTTKYSPTTIADNIESGHFAHWAETQHRGDYKESQP